MTSPASADWLRRRLVARFWCDRIRERLAKSTGSNLPTELPRQLTLPGVWAPSNEKGTKE